jgi:magnesium-transporting ATPase (P-type)
MMTFLTSESASVKSYNEVLSMLTTDLRQGLSENEVLLRRKLHSTNDFKVAQADPLWKKYLEQVRVYNYCC